MPPVSERPNILLITSDQQHHSTLVAANDRISTPCLDRLCREGTRFTRACCPNPTCTPTRASILTGLMPSQHGAWTLGTKLMEDVPTLGQYLSRAGYRTSLIGKAHFQPTRSSPQFPSVESESVVRDLDYWREFHGPWYGFDHIEIMRNHGDQWSCGQHYALWMEQAGLENWRDYFADRRGDRSARERKGYYDPSRRCWDLPEEYHYNRFIAEKTLEQLGQAVREDRPFFCWASFPDPHPPLRPSPGATCTTRIGCQLRS